MPLMHDTIEVRRSFKHPLDKLFDVWSNPTHLAAWPFKVHSEFKGRLDQFDFRTGGTKRLLYHDLAGNSFVENAIYIDIKINSRIVLIEQLFNRGRLLSAALTSLEFTGDASGSTSQLTDQIAVLGTRDDVESRRRGWTDIFDTVDGYLASL